MFVMICECWKWGWFGENICYLKICTNPWDIYLFGLNSFFDKLVFDVNGFGITSDVWFMQILNCVVVVTINVDWGNNFKIQRFRQFLINCNSWTTEAKATYSACIVEVAINFCFVDFQEIGVWFMKMTKPVVECRSSRSAKLESENAVSLIPFVLLVLKIRP